MQLVAGKWRIGFEMWCRKVAVVEGINSNIGDTGKHIILWDFDDVKLSDLKQILTSQQEVFCLPTIYIVESSECRYHAYCFDVRPLAEVVYILASTSCIDSTYVRLGFIRGYWTLRISQKEPQKKFKLVAKLLSDVPENLEILDRLDIVKYTTKLIGHDDK